MVDVAYTSIIESLEGSLASRDLAEAWKFRIIAILAIQRRFDAKGITSLSLIPRRACQKRLFAVVTSASHNHGLFSRRFIG